MGRCTNIHAAAVTTAGVAHCMVQFQSQGNAQRTALRVYTCTPLQEVLEGCWCSLLQVVMDHTAFVLPSKTRKHIVLLSQGWQMRNICGNACQARANCIILQYQGKNRVAFKRRYDTCRHIHSFHLPTVWSPPYSRMPGCKQAAGAQRSYKIAIRFHVSFATYFLSRSQWHRPVLERTWAVKWHSDDSWWGTSVICTPVGSSHSQNRRYPFGPEAVPILVALGGCSTWTWWNRCFRCRSSVGYTSQIQFPPLNGSRLLL